MRKLSETKKHGPVCRSHWSFMFGAMFEPVAILDTFLRDWCLTFVSELSGFYQEKYPKNIKVAPKPLRYSSKKVPRGGASTTNCPSGFMFILAKNIRFHPQGRAAQVVTLLTIEKWPKEGSGEVGLYPGRGPTNFFFRSQGNESQSIGTDVCRCSIFSGC